MARAYQEMRKPDAKPPVLKLFCSNCDEWEETSGWIFHTVYVHTDSTYSFYDSEDDYVFGLQCEEQEVYEHDSCGEWFRWPDEDQTGDKIVWICGVCGRRTYDQNAARRCCT